MTEEFNGGEAVTTEGTRLLVTTNAGEMIIDLPAGCRVTFGAVNPGGNSQGMASRDLHCMRVWEGTGKSAILRAVFCDVRGFRDLSIPLARKVERQVGSTQWTSDFDGAHETTSRHQLESRFDPEAPVIDGEAF
jgi:hypothetical protein